MMAEKSAEPGTHPPERAAWGVLLANLGTPEAPDRRHVARFLREFLSDPRVVDLPRWLWLPLLNCVIIPLRAARSAAAYQKIWLAEGSPLLVFTQRLTAALKHALPQARAVVAGMRYGQPGIAAALQQLRSAGVERVCVLPLYPQFSGTTTASIYDAVDAALQRMDWQPEVIRINDYYRAPGWINAVAASVVEHRRQHGAAERLIFSLHGIPQRYVRQGDPYQQHCEASVRAIAAAAGLAEDEWILTYQSRVGREPWLQPYTDTTLQALAGQGIQRVQVVCPGFAVDCLETLEEIALQNAELFEASGGERLDYIPALNDSKAHAAALQQVVETALGQAQP